MTNESNSAHNDGQTLLEKKSVSAAKILQNVILISFRARIWTAKQVLTGSDLPDVDKDDLPPSYLASLGSKKLIDDNLLKPFHNIRQRAKRVLETYGIEFMGGAAVSLQKTAKVAAELDSLREEFETTRDTFIKDYEANRSEWINANQNWKHALEARPVPIEKIKASFYFDWVATHVTPPKGKNKALTRGFDTQVEGLPDRLFDDIANEANDILTKSFVGVSRVQQKVLHRVIHIKSKLDDLQFLHPSAFSLVQAIDYVMSMLPPSGYIEGVSFDALYKMLEILSIKDKAIAFGTEISNGKSVELAISDVVDIRVKSTKPAKNIFDETESSSVSLDKQNHENDEIRNILMGNELDSEAATVATAQVTSKKPKKAEQGKAVPTQQESTICSPVLF